MKVIIAKAILRNSSGDVLLVRRSKTAPRRALEWDFPGGFVDDSDESYQQACLREVIEETGLQVVNDKLHLSFTESALLDFDSNGKEKDVSWLYFTGKVNSTEVTLSFEHDDSCWVSLGEVAKLITYDTQLKAINYLQQQESM